MHFPGLFPWKEAPFVRLFPSFLLGILSGWYGHFPGYFYWLLAFALSAGLAWLSRLSLSLQFKWRIITGLLLHGLLFVTGMLLVYYHEVRHHPQWLGHQYRAGDGVLVTIAEPVSETDHGYKTTAIVQGILSAGKVYTTKGKLLLYFAKAGMPSTRLYGAQLLFHKRLEAVRESGNPGAFNYARYCAANGLHHQVYLRENEYHITAKTTGNTVKSILYHTREKVLNIIRENIAGKKQAGLAEALLLGYKGELDADLLQSYTDTGVVHIIAVSGLHLGLIYGVLLGLCNLLGGGKASWRRPAVILTGLWLFALLAGGSPSVLRSAIMFSCLAIGRELGGRSSVYNSLAASAFLVLCYHPSWWQDAGFLLSYAAVLSILLFMKPIYNLLPIQNKLLDLGWKSVALTVAAQVLTTPLLIYYFHQFPNLFLLTNLVAVPLSSLILLGELLLCALAWAPPLAGAIGWLLGKSITVLNGFVEKVQYIPFNTTTGLQLSTLQLLIIYTGIAFLGMWLLRKRQYGLPVALLAAWLFMLSSFYNRWQATQQCKLIVYNVPKRQAMDFIQGRHYVFKGDETLSSNNRLSYYHLQPSRTLYRMSQVDSMDGLLQQAPFYHLGHRSVLVVDSSMRFRKGQPAIPVDHVVLSHNAKVSVKELTSVFSFSSIIIDASNSRWKTSSWREDCRRLGIACHSVATDGAFVLPLH